MRARSRRRSRPGSASATRRTTRTFAALVVATGLGGTVALAACLGLRPYACVEDDQCVQGGERGTCEVTGWCSYADDDCDSGRRYGELAGSGLADQCVVHTEHADDTGSDTAADDSGTGDATSETGGSTSPGTEGETCEPDCVEPGTLLWMVVEDGPAGGSDALLNVAVDPTDRIFVIGFVSVPGQGNDILLRELDSHDGETIWTVTYDHMGASEKGWGIAIDSENAVLVAGEGSGASPRAYVGRYGDDGTLLWELDREGMGFEIDVNADDDVVVVGRLGDEVWLAKYDRDGEPIWEHTEPGPSGSAVGWDLTIAPNGDVVAIGSEQTMDGSRSWLRRYTDDGTALELQWTRGLSGAGSGPNEGLGNAMTPDGDIVAVGNMSVENDFHAWVAKYGAGGELEWTKGHTGEDGRTANAHHVAVDEAGNLHVVGWKRASDDLFEAWVGKYSPDGDEIWSHTHRGDGDAHHRGYGIAVDALGHVLAVGYLHTEDGGDDLWAAKYAP